MDMTVKGYHRDLCGDPIVLNLDCGVGSMNLRVCYNYTDLQSRYKLLLAKEYM